MMRACHLLVICLFSFATVTAHSDSSAIQSAPLTVHGEDLTLVVVKPLGPNDPEAPIAKALLHAGFRGLIQIYKDEGVIGPADQLMEEGILKQATNLEAISVLLFARQKDGTLGEFRGMLRAYFPDHTGMLSAEKEALHLQRQNQTRMKNQALYYVPDQNEWKFEIGSYATNRAWAGPLLVQHVVNELEVSGGNSGRLLLQTVEGLHERTYRSFYGFKSLLSFDDPRIADRRTVIMETPFENFRDKVRQQSMSSTLSCEGALDSIGR